MPEDWIYSVLRKKGPQYEEMFFANLLKTKFNTRLGTSISLDIVYDDDVIGKTQIK